jgi:hypothetical protein
MPQFTLTLSNVTAEQVTELINVTGGSVPGFAASWTTDLARLRIEQLAMIRKLVADLARQNSTQPQSPAPALASSL